LATKKAETTNALAALGVPTKGGQVDWPLGLRILPPSEKAGELRQQLDGLLQLAASHGDSQVNPHLVEASRVAVEELHELLRSKKSAYLAQHTYNEADRFLEKLADALKLLQ